MPPLRHYAVIPNAVDLGDYAGPVDRAAVRAALGVPADAPLLLMAGRISPWKGQHVFVEALAHVRETHPTVHGVIVGLAEEADGPGYAGRVQAQAEALGLGQHLHMAGFRGDMPQVLAAADVVVPLFGQAGALWPGDHRRHGGRPAGGGQRAGRRRRDHQRRRGRPADPGRRCGRAGRCAEAPAGRPGRATAAGPGRPAHRRPALSGGRARAGGPDLLRARVGRGARPNVRIAILGAYSLQDNRISGGPEAVVVQLADGLRRLPGMDVHVFTTSGRVAEDSVQQRDGITVHTLRLRRVPRWTLVRVNARRPGPGCAAHRARRGPRPQRRHLWRRRARQRRAGRDHRPRRDSPGGAGLSPLWSDLAREPELALRGVVRASLPGPRGRRDRHQPLRGRFLPQHDLGPHAPGGEPGGRRLLRPA